MTDSKITFRMKHKAKALFDLYLELTGLTASEVARGAIADKIMASPLLVGHVSDILAHTGDCNKSLSKDKGAVRRHDKDFLFFKTFIGAVDNKQFPNRVSKAIAENWQAITDSGLAPKEMAEIYNQYCKSVPDTQTPSHPNSWIAGHGWDNTKYEKKDENYDF